MNGAPFRVVCMKWDGRYGPGHVRALRAMVEKHAPGPLEFVCFADYADGLPDGTLFRPIRALFDRSGENAYSAWLKLGLFAADLFDAPAAPRLFLDLDIVIRDSLAPFFDFPAEFAIAQNWQPWRKSLLRTPPRVGNSSVFRWIPSRSGDILERFRRDPADAKSRYPTEQAFVSAAAGERLRFWPGRKVVSWKRHCARPFPLNMLAAPAEPDDAHIVVFHGEPKPEDVAAGISSGRLRLRTPPCPWVARHYPNGRGG